MIKIQAWATSDASPQELNSDAFTLDAAADYHAIWIDISGENDGEHREFIGSKLHIPQLAIDDALRQRHPPKFESLPDDWIFTLVRGLDADTVDINFKTIQLSFFWRGNVLVTRHNRPSASINGVTKRLAEESRPARSAGELLYLILRTMHDRYLPIVLDLEQRLEEIEELLISRPSDLLLQELMEYSRQLKKLRRIANYHEVAFKRMLSADTKMGWNLNTELFDLHEQAERLASLSNLQYEITSDMINGYLSVSSHRLNNVMRVLTVVTVLFVPLTFIAGIYGMNFEYIPELGVRGGYFVVWGVMITIAVTLLAVFKKETLDLIAMADTTSMFGQFVTSAVHALNFPLVDLGKGPVTAATICAGLAVILAALLLSRGIRRSIRRVNSGRYAMAPSSRYALERLAHYCVLILGVVVALSTAGLDFGKLAMLASALSVGIGFGLQALVSNFVSGLMLLIERSLKVGDFVELDSGIAGVVTEIRVRATVITTNDNAEVIVPNSEFINVRMTNWTHSNNYYRHKIPFGVAYGTDTALVKSVVLEAALAVSFTLSDTDDHKPNVWMTGFGDSSLDFALMVWVKPECATRPGAVKSAYFYAIDNALREANITIPFPQRDVHMIPAG